MFADRCKRFTVCNRIFVLSGRTASDLTARYVLHRARSFTVNISRDIRRSYANLTAILSHGFILSETRNAKLH